MNMCESNLTRTYLKISKASCPRCTGIAGVPLPYPRELYLAFSRDFGYLGKVGGDEVPTLKSSKEGGDGESVLMTMIQLTTLHM